MTVMRNGNIHEIGGIWTRFWLRATLRFTINEAVGLSGFVYILYFYQGILHVN